MKNVKSEVKDTKRKNKRTNVMAYNTHGQCHGIQHSATQNPSKTYLNFKH